MLSNAGLPDSSYNPKDDCWSLGVILYILLSGQPRFSEDRKCGLSLRAQILQANYQLHPALYNPLSAEAKARRRGDPAAPLAAGASDGAAGRGADGVLGGEKRKRLGEDGEHR